MGKLYMLRAYREYLQVYNIIDLEHCIHLESIGNIPGYPISPGQLRLGTLHILGDYKEYPGTSYKFKRAKTGDNNTARMLSISW